MDILEQYNKEEKSVLSVPATRGNELRTPKMVAWVLRHSGGVIKTERHAAYVLLGLACIIGLISIFLFVGSIGGPYTERGPGLTPKEQEEYKKIQPF